MSRHDERRVGGCDQVFGGVREVIRPAISDEEPNGIETGNGKIVESPYHVVDFNDGSTWSTRNSFYQADQELKLSAEKEKEILAFVEMKRGIEIERYDFLNKDEDQ